MIKQHEYSEQEIDRQNRVDNAIFKMLQEVTPIAYMQWDMEIIGEVRDIVMNYVVNQKGWMKKEWFYPYRELERDPSTEPKSEVLTVTVDQLDKAIKEVVNELDFDDLAKVASDFLGGLCVWKEGDNFIFIPDENYCGALDFTKEKKNDS